MYENNNLVVYQIPFGQCQLSSVIETIHMANHWLEQDPSLKDTPKLIESLHTIDRFKSELLAAIDRHPDITNEVALQTVFGFDSDLCIEIERAALDEYLQACFCAATHHHDTSCFGEAVSVITTSSRIQ